MSLSDSTVQLRTDGVIATCTYLSQRICSKLAICWVFQMSIYKLSLFASKLTHFLASYDRDYCIREHLRLWSRILVDRCSLFLVLLEDRQGPGGLEGGGGKGGGSFGCLRGQWGRWRDGGVERWRSGGGGTVRVGGGGGGVLAS